MDPCEYENPRVINNALINKCIEEQRRKDTTNQFIEETDDDIPQMEDVEAIRLEFLRILRIDHLWMMKNLRKLCLNNNFIEKIENLDELTNLVELDLSFNKIHTIENLEKLINIEKLSLYSNLIKKIENLDSQKKLNILSIGKNAIEDPDDIIYLRRFKNLRSLNLSENFTMENLRFDNSTLRIFIAAMLPQLIYYEYVIVSDYEREKGLETYKKLLETIENEEAELFEQQMHEENVRRAQELYEKSFVELLDENQLFLSLFELDEEGKAFLKMGEEAQEIYNEYEINFVECTKKIFEIGQEQYSIREEEVKQFMECLEEARLKNQKESIEHLEKFLDLKDKVFLKVKNYQNSLNNDEIKYEVFLEELDPIALHLQAEIHGIWKTLMKLEMELFESTEEVLQGFEHTLKEMVNNFIEAAQAQFSIIRGHESTYQENIADCAQKFTTIVITENITVPEELETIISDKEILQNALAASLDMHMQIIDNREDLLISKATKWLDDLIKKLERFPVLFFQQIMGSGTIQKSILREEIKRNRDKVLEINHFLDMQREEFEDLTEEHIGLDADADVTALLTETV